MILTGDPSKYGTPVDTGWASSNWLMSIDKTINETVGSKDAVDASVQQDMAESILAEFDVTMDRKLIISNHVPYIQRLNEPRDKGGQPWSAQSPQAHWVQQAIFKGIATVRAG